MYCMDNNEGKKDAFQAQVIQGSTKRCSMHLCHWVQHVVIGGIMQQLKLWL